MKYFGRIQDKKDLTTKEYVDEVFGIAGSTAHLGFEVASVQISSEQVSTITIPDTISYLEEGLLVYQNGLLLSNDSDYTIDVKNRTITLVGYSADLNDTFTILSIFEEVKFVGKTSFPEPTKEDNGKILKVANGRASWSDLVEVLSSINQLTFKIDDTLSFEDEILKVNTAKDVEQDNTLPITSAAVFKEIGNINALLETI